MIILRVKNPLKIIKSLRSARLALSKGTIAPTRFLGIYELILNILELWRHHIDMRFAPPASELV